MGVSSKKQTQTTNETQNATATSTPNVPDWLSNPAQQIAGNLSGLIGQGSSAYTPTISDTQQSFYDKVGGLTGVDMSSALSELNSHGDISGESLLTGLEGYYNPFKDQILNPLMNDYDAEAGRTRAAQAADAAKTKAFGGSRYGVAQAATEGELARGRAAVEGSTLKDMFNTSTSLSGQDAQRRQDAAATNAANSIARAQAEASIRAQQAADERANLGLLGDAGTQKTAMENLIKQYPLAYQEQMNGLLAGLNPSMFSGQTTTSSGTSSGTSTGKTSGGFLGDLMLALASSAGGAAKAFAGGA